METTSEPIDSADAAALAATLPLDEKVALLTGAGTWTLTALPALGMRTVTLSDGPIGIRGSDDDVQPAAQLPAPSATAATWDPEIQRRIGRLMADEARRKGVDVVLAPVVNLQRTPVGGRHFECLSEDPNLTARLAVAFIAALQERGVGACVKHFIGNESETDRTAYLSRIDEQTLREVYLAPFEAVVDVGVWSIMAAYNGIAREGVEAPATEHGPLVDGVLRGELGFEGVVVSDWLATRSTVESALGGLDLVMPGPGGPWGERLLAAVRDGRVPESVIDEKVGRIVGLAAHVGALSGVPGVLEPYDDHGVTREPDAPEVRALLTELAARSTVVLRNAGETPVLPVDPGLTGRVALIGANAAVPFTQGGGSAFVTPPLVAEPLQALRDALPNATVTLHRGGATELKAPVPDARLLSTPGGEPGILVELLDREGETVETVLVGDASRIWLPVADARVASARLRARLALESSGRHEIELGPVGAHRIEIDGTLLSESSELVGSEVILDSSYSNPASATRVIETDAASIARIDATLQIVDGESYGRFVRMHLRYRAPGLTVEEEIEAAERAARDAALAVVVVGTNPETESEGWDRPDLRLPGRQNELVRRVAAANPNTVVVVNAGAPVILPWLDEVPAVLWWWLPGQEAGTSLAAVLTGAIEPSGRLPWTLPSDEADVPVPHGLHVDGYLDYEEGVDVGHRGWDRLGRTPAREFGYGLGYTAWEHRGLELTTGGEAFVEASVLVANAGERDGREVVQLYLEAPDGPHRRPLRWLAGSGVVDVPAGGVTTVRIPIERRSFEVWDAEDSAWTLPGGSYTVRVGRSSRDLRQEAVLEL